MDPHGKFVRVLRGDPLVRVEEVTALLPDRLAAHAAEDVGEVRVSSPEDPAPRGPVRIADLAGRPMVMFRHGYDLRELTVAACRAEGFEPSFAVEGGEMDAVLGFVRAGLGVAVVPGMVAARAGRDLRVTALAPPGLRRTVALAHRSDVAPPRAARELRRVLLRSTAEG